MGNLIRRAYLLMLIIFATVAVISCNNGLPAEGSLENPLVLTGYSGSGITYSGFVGVEKLYIKVVDIPYFNNQHSVGLTDLTDNADLYTYTDAFVSLQNTSENSGTTNESCYGTTTATGELYIMIDGTNTTNGTNFTLSAGT